MVSFAAWPALRGQMNWEVMKLVCSLVCFIHTVFVQFLFLTEFGHWNSYHFLWPVFHEVSSFFTLWLKNVLVKLFLLREWITKLMELLFLYFSINECDDLISTMFCHAGLAFSEATPTTRENLLCVWLSQDCSFSLGCTAFCFSWYGNWWVFLTATFLSGKTIQVLRMTCVILLKATKNYRAWMLIPFSCLKLEVCFRKAFCENCGTFFCRWVRGPFLKRVGTEVLRLWVQSITLNSLWLLYETMPWILSKKLPK